MMKRTLILFCFIFFMLSLFAFAPIKIDRQRVDKLMMSRDYSAAKNIISDMLVHEPYNEEYNFMFGVCLFHTTNNINKAITQLEKAHEMTKKRKLLIEIKYFLAKAYHINMQFDKAINMYSSIKNELFARNKRKLKEIDRLISNCEYARKVCSNPLNVNFSLVSDLINTSTDEHSPCFSADERYMIFTSRRKNSDSVALDGKYYEKIYCSISDGKSWCLPELLKEDVSSVHKASVSMSFDGRVMLMYIANSNDNKTMDGDLYICNRVGYEWSEPVKLPDSINSSNRETHAALSADGNTIYFSSDRPGGKGGLDIYKSVKSDSGSWGKVENLGENINTKFDEISPSIQTNGKVLYFSSNRELSVGGYDIYSSKLSKGVWMKSKNMGYPINSTRDDIYFNITADGRRAYMASRRIEGPGLLDIYKLEMLDVKPNRSFIVRGVIGDLDDSISRDAYCLKIKQQGSDTLTVYPDSVTGEFVFSVDADKQYEVNYSKVGFETLNSILMLPYSFYNEINHGIISLNLISLNKKVGLYKQKDLSFNTLECGLKETYDINKVVLKVLNETPVFYTVQIMAMRRPLAISYFAKFGDNVSAVLGNDGLTRYLYKSYRDLDEAQMVMMRLRDIGFWDAFVRESSDGIPGRILDDSEVVGNNSPIKPTHK